MDKPPGLRIGRKIFLVLAAVVVSSVFGLLFLRRLSTTCVSEERFDRIKEGMSLREVSAIMGWTPGDYTTGPVEFLGGSVDMAEEWPQHFPHPLDGDAAWCADTGMLIVYFCKGRAAAKWYRPCAPIPETTSQRIDRWMYQMNLKQKVRE